MFEIISIDELLRRLDKYNHKELHVHHTWKPSHKDFTGSNGVQLQENMKKYHVNTLKWNDIGQHVTLLPDGTFVTGRDFSKNPASISGKNTGAFACEMLGNFDAGNDKLEGKQKDSILRLARYFDDKGKYVRFHRENSPKTCPGTSIDRGQFMNEVKNYVKQPSNTQNKGNIEIGTKVKVTGNKYATGQKIPDWVKKNTYTVTQIRENKALLSDIISWVYITDLVILDILDSREYPGHSSKKGAKGEPVKLIQQKLKALGLYKGEIDGSFGGLTLSAVLAFQKSKGLSQDGSVGPATWAKLFN